jgi:WD40 repeat protein
MATLVPAPSGVLAVAIAPSGEMLATGEAKHAIRLWNVGERREIGKIDDYTGPVLSIAFSPDSRLLASNAGGYEVRIWDVKDGTTQRELTNPRNPTAGGKTTQAVANGRSELFLVRGGPPSPMPGNINAAMVGHYPTFNCSVEFSRDGQWLAITRHSEERHASYFAEVYDVARGQRVSRNWSYGVATFSPDGKRLATSGIVRPVILDPATGWRISAH